MAYNLKREGSTFVVSDTETLIEAIRKKRVDMSFIFKQADVVTFTYLDKEELPSYRFSDLIDDSTGSAFNSVSELKTFLSTVLGTNDEVTESKTTYSLSRVEQIDNSSANSLEYFTFSQGGTEISNSINIDQGSYTLSLYILAQGTSTNGRVEIGVQVGGVDLFSSDFIFEPKDTRSVIPLSASRLIAFNGGVETFTIDFSISGSGSARIYEAHLILRKS